MTELFSTEVFYGYKKYITLFSESCPYSKPWPCSVTLSSWLKGQPGYKLHEAEGEREMPCPFIGGHCGKTCDWLFRKAGNSYHLSICKQAGEDKRWVMKFLVWGHQLITSGMQGKNLPPRQLPEEPRADADTLLECLVFPWSISCCSKVAYKLCRRFPHPSCI